MATTTTTTMTTTTVKAAITTMGSRAVSAAILPIEGPVDSGLRQQLDACRLCPRRCGANRNAGQRGVCGAADELRVARAALHFWEEPPISGSTGSGTVFFSHCPLRCAYCQNAEISHRSAGKDISTARLAEIFLELEAQGARNINLVTPTHYATHIIEALGLARDAGLQIPAIYNTAGYELPGTLRLLEGFVPAFLTDFKYWDDQWGRRYSQVDDYVAHAKEALAAMAAQAGPVRYAAFRESDLDPMLVSGVIVRHLLLPGRLDDAKAIVRYVYDNYGDDVALSLMSQYTPMPGSSRFPELAAGVAAQEYEALLDYADSIGVSDYFWQEGAAALESFIPAFDGTGV
ncbi:MAG: radical SAM protein [Eggerthellaceae bacterium]|nr:radical SAM protein [Eggerthellaceae bacterium]